MTTATVSIDRTSLSLPDPLVIAGTRPATYFISGDTGLGRPAITRRNTYMPDSPDTHGSELLNSVKEQSSLPLTVQVQTATAAALDTALSDLYDALDQFSYQTTVTVDGTTKVWTCDPASYGSVDGAVSAIRQAAFIEIVAITIPVHPIPGA